MTILGTFSSTTVSNGRPERKDVTARIEQQKIQQDEADRAAASQRNLNSSPIPSSSLHPPPVPKPHPHTPHP